MTYQPTNQTRTFMIVWYASESTVAAHGDFLKCLRLKDIELTFVYNRDKPKKTLIAA